MQGESAWCALCGAALAEQRPVWVVVLRGETKPRSFAAHETCFRGVADHRAIESLERDEPGLAVTDVAAVVGESRVTVGSLLGEAWGVYRLLVRRSLRVSAVIYAIVGAAFYGAGQVDSDALRALLAISTIFVGFGGPAVVQGALVALVDDVHEGTRPRGVPTILGVAWRRLPSLLWAAIVYSVCTVVGLLLLIVPGLLVAARWCLMVPHIVLREMTTYDARTASSNLVRGHTWPVLGALLITFVATTTIAVFPLIRFDEGSLSEAVLSWAISSVTAPFTAHLLTVIYFRLSEPTRPVISPQVRAWASIWDGA